MQSDKSLVLGDLGEETIAKLLIIEPYYGGSHKKMIETITTNLPGDMYTLVTMAPKKWHWRARTSALFVSMKIPRKHSYNLLFCTSVLPLAELIGLRPDIAHLNKILYFHENQLEFPVRPEKERDFQYGFNEILSCLAADQVLFNSKYNMETFLSKIPNHLKHQPDYRGNWVEPLITAKSKVVYYPINLSIMDSVPECDEKEQRQDLVIVWPHRWAFDKNPEAFYTLIRKLDADQLNFKVCLLGESYSKKSAVFNNMDSEFRAKRVLHCGFIPNELDYFAMLKKADVVVSTAIQEFFGVAVLEAIYCGCIPVLPKRLAYNELYGDEVEEMYDNDEEMYIILKALCRKKKEGTLRHNYRRLALRFAAEIWLSETRKYVDWHFID